MGGEVVNNVLLAESQLPPYLRQIVEYAPYTTSQGQVSYAGDSGKGVLYQSLCQAGITAIYSRVGLEDVLQLLSAPWIPLQSMDSSSREYSYPPLAVALNARPYIMFCLQRKLYLQYAALLHQFSPLEVTLSAYVASWAVGSWWTRLGKPAEAEQLIHYTPAHYAVVCNEQAAFKPSSGVKKIASGHVLRHEEALQGAVLLAHYGLLPAGRLAAFAKASHHINQPDSRGWTALHHAACAGRLSYVQTLLANGAHIDAQDSRGATPLWLSASANRLEVCQFLLQQGAVTHLAIRVETLAQNPLHTAIKKSHLRIVKCLLGKPGMLESKDFELNRPLHYAIWRGVTMVKAVLAHQPDLQAENRQGETALHLAAGLGDEAVCEALLTAGALADVEDEFGDTPLHSAARKGAMGVCQRLVKAGADVTRANFCQRTACADALLKGHAEVADYLSTEHSPLPLPPQTSLWQQVCCCAQSQ